MADTPVPKIFAGIVIYFPDPEKLNNLIKAIDSQVDKIIIFNNGGFNPDSLNPWDSNLNLDVIGNGTNLGIGVALNEICRVSEENRANYLITFDQDSSPGDNLVLNLREELEVLRDSRKRVAAVGPMIIDGRIQAAVFPIFQSGTFWISKRYPTKNDIEPIPTIQLITSGMLIDLTAFKDIGPFRESYFIDYVDTEWCLRGSKAGYDFYICPRVVMYHELSSSAPHRFLGRLILKYPTTRRYYTTRNAIFLIKEKHSPVYIKIYLILTLMYRSIIYFIVDTPKVDLLKALARGILDGAVGKGGIYKDN